MRIRIPFEQCDTATSSGSKDNSATDAFFYFYQTVATEMTDFFFCEFAALGAFILLADSKSSRVSMSTSFLVHSLGNFIFDELHNQLQRLAYKNVVRERLCAKICGEDLVVVWL